MAEAVLLLEYTMAALPSELPADCCEENAVVLVLVDGQVHVTDVVPTSIDQAPLTDIDGAALIFIG